MAGSLSDYLELKLLDQIVGKTDYTMPTASVALCTAAVTDAHTGATMTEVTDASAYARVATAGGDWNAAAAGSMSNANDITFTEATGAWGTVTHFAVLDSAVHGAGNILFHGSLTTSKAVTDGDIVEFAGGAPGDLVLTLA